MSFQEKFKEQVANLLLKKGEREFRRKRLDSGSSPE
jgi:hypothetical protein